MARMPKGQNFSTYTEPSFKFGYDEKWYTVQGAETMVSIGTKDDMSTMRTEYTRMRDAAQKRVARLQKMFPESVGAQRKYNTGKTDIEGKPIYKSGFPTLKSLDSRDFAKAFSEVAKFLKAKGSTVTGQKEIQQKTMKTLNKAIGAEPGTGVTKANYWRVIKILEAARRQKITYGSDKVVELAESTMALDNSQFDDIIDKLEKFYGHEDEVQTALGSYAAAHQLSGYNQVDMSEFLEELGW